MERAFKVYWSRTGILLNDCKISYNNASAPQNLIARLRPLGLTPIPGLGRRPIFNATPTLARVIAANVRAAVLLSQRIKQSIGIEYKVFDTIKALWKPRANIELDLLIDQALDQKKGIDINTTTFVMRHTQKIVAEVLKGPCYYGHNYTTFVNSRGIGTWQRPPATVRASHPFGAVVCQRCYVLLAKGKQPKHVKPSNSSRQGSQAAGKTDNNNNNSNNTDIDNTNTDDDPILMLLCSAAAARPADVHHTSSTARPPGDYRPPEARD